MTFCSNTSGPSTRVYTMKFGRNKIKHRRKLLSRIVFCWLELDIAWQQQTITSYCLWMLTRMLLWTLNYLFHIIYCNSVIYIHRYGLSIKKQILCILKILRWSNVKLQQHYNGWSIELILQLFWLVDSIYQHHFDERKCVCKGIVGRFCFREPKTI